VGSVLGVRLAARPELTILKVLTARAATRSTVSDGAVDSESISIFARRVRGIASVGEKAIEFVNET
jgi:hypothetical protein